MKKRLIVLFLLICMVFSLGLASQAAPPQPGISYNKADIAQGMANSNLTTFHETMVTSEMLLEHYAGSYVGDDGSMHVKFTEDLDTLISSEISKRYSSESNTVSARRGYSIRIPEDIEKIIKLQVAAEIIYEPAKYTWIELGTLANWLGDVFFDENGDIIPELTSVWGWGSDVYTNTVQIRIDEGSNIDNFIGFLENNGFSRDMISTREGVRYQPQTAVVNGSEAAVLYSGGGVLFTIGAGARKKSTGEVGVIVCGHGLMVNDIVYSGGGRVGVVKNRNYSGSIDGSFIAFDSGYTPTRTFTNGDTYAAVGTNSTPFYKDGVLIYTNFNVGAEVSLYGGQSGKVNGKITQISCLVQVGTLLLTDQIDTTVVSQGGDSGGALTYFQAQSLASGVKQVCGILSGGDEISGSSYTNAVNIYNQFGLDNGY